MEKVIERLINGRLLSYLLVFMMLMTIVLLVLYFVAPQQRLNHYLELGQKYLFEEDYEDAIASFEMVLEIDSRNESAYLGMVDAYIGLGEYDKAKEVLDEANSKLDSQRVRDKYSELSLAVAYNSADEIDDDKEDSGKTIASDSKDLSTKQLFLSLHKPRIVLKDIIEGDTWTIVCDVYQEDYIPMEDVRYCAEGTVVQSLKGDLFTVTEVNVGIDNDWCRLMLVDASGEYEYYVDNEKVDYIDPDGVNYCGVKYSWAGITRSYLVYQDISISLSTDVKIGVLKDYGMVMSHENQEKNMSRYETSVQTIDIHGCQNDIYVLSPLQLSEYRSDFSRFGFFNLLFDEDGNVTYLEEEYSS